MSDYERTTTTSAGNTKTVPRSELSAKSNRSTSSGRGSVEEDEDADVEIRMINEGNWNMQTSVQSTTGKFEKRKSFGTFCHFLAFFTILLICCKNLVFFIIFVNTFWLFWLMLKSK